MAVLPIGVRTQEEEGEVIPGTVSSAPAEPGMRRKFILTSLLAIIPWTIAFILMEYEIIDLEELPFLPKFSND